MANAKTDWKDGDTITKEAMNDIGNDIKANRDKNTTQDEEIEDLKDNVATKVDNVSTENAGTIGAEFNQTEVQKIATLADANKAAINAVIDALKAAGLMSNQ